MSQIFVTMPLCNVIHCKLTIYPTHLIPFRPCCSTEAILAIEKQWLYLHGGKKKRHSTCFSSEVPHRNMQAYWFQESAGFMLLSSSLRPWQQKVYFKWKQERNSRLCIDKNTKVKSTIRIRLKHYRFEPPTEISPFKICKPEPPPPRVKALSQQQMKGNATKSSYCNLK